MSSTDHALTIRFFGVRGSIASAGAHTAGVGGNTSCVLVDIDDGEGEAAPPRRLIFDAGTGLRAAGGELLRASGGGPVEVALFLSHFHWDHIQGFPFFGPAYVPGSRISVYGPERSTNGNVRAALEAQMRAPHFPVGLDAMRAELAFHAVPAGGEVRLSPAARVRAAAACHPNGCLAYRVESHGRAVVYATDTEHDAASGALDERLVELARGADVLIYDAQYTDAEYAAGKRGWGHSTAAEGARVARAAGVGQLVLFHHDPARSDEGVAAIEAETRRAFPATVAAREGLTITLGPSAMVRAA
jgi:phosphoribosyl 1,2-cyclic phosphodiesterase